MSVSQSQPVTAGASVDTTGKPTMTRGLAFLLATATGAAVAQMYYAQPLLHTLGRVFHTSTATTGLLVTIGQVGYVFGLAFLVPLGDLVERRRLIVSAMLLAAVWEAVEAAAPDLAVFGVATLFVGLATFIAQVIVPLSAHLAAEHERGRVVGLVMSGLLIGILLSRTVSGIIAQAFGWRVVFAFGAVSMTALAMTLQRKLPKVKPTSRLPYREALASVVALVRTEPLLRQRMFLGGCVMGCFSALWTAVAFLLAGEHGSHYHYSNLVIGLFGLAGVAGAFSAQIVGRLADRGHVRLTTTVTLLLLLLSWLILDLGANSVIVLIIGIMVLDAGVQGTQLSNQTAIYRLHPDARSRITTAYMVAYFTGGILLSSVTGALYAADGWSAVCLMGAITTAAALVVWFVTIRRVAIPAAQQTAA